ncbi:peptidoglycan-associated lipoprotein [Desulfuromonas versatilis]|uniref:Peptidoglycan-associated lipoprotein n=1 Tax=Desulfuromonas versatilis TaxID=2802975 RepID=A0ABM8HVY2_9BACT|nr:peptidoglycan-associated lipoprotein Pal [Desulfuromonas versatilis]BCR06157.1 peptidoglycan-associated lipoprotein [Desulfuromonas versatilis]
MKKATVSLVLALCCALLASGCAKKPKVTETLPTAQPALADTQDSSKNSNFNQNATGDLMVGNAQTGMQAIYFEFDSVLLSDEARATLQKNAQWLKSNAGSRITIEGHTDERGSDAYNLALGERRAVATRNYLVTLGVSADRIQIISYGEERPALQGSTEDAWSKNRRAEFM